MNGMMGPDRRNRDTMNLKDLISAAPEAELKGDGTTTITGITADSRRVGHGFLFVARRGAVHDGYEYIPQAIAAGAAAVLTDLYDPTLEATQIIHPDPTLAEQQLAAAFYQYPSKELFTVGITGTCGKTTTAYLVQHLLTPCGLIGTIEYLVGDRRYEATRTTPDVCNNHRMLREMIDAQCTAAVMEVTSHALVQGRVAGIDYDVAIFTNLSQEHQDYHDGLEDYCRAKGRLFTNLDGIAVVNGDSPWLNVLLEDCSAERIHYGLDPKHELYASDIEASSQGTRFTVHYKGESAKVSWGLVGTFNVYNGLAALGAALVQGQALADACQRLSLFAAVPGRLERVTNPLGLTIYVDYAHKPEALENVLKTLLPHVKGRLICVFGCGGDRDRDKRHQMGGIAATYSDLVIVTSDNPRSEDPQSICNDIVKGIPATSQYQVEVDRRRAIEAAVAQAGADDLVLIAGKGHERIQIVGHLTRPFDDREEALRACEAIQVP